ncbi:MAG: hypothetical protein JXB19_08205 [Bacteroidales bacterium]|nr:hypothetical protein [Bacteroidales bacterium]
MLVEKLTFGSVTIDGVRYDKDVIIDRGEVKKRKKSESKKYRDRFGHTPLSAEENIPWNCKHLIIGTGHSESLPVMDEVLETAVRRGVNVTLMSTPEAVKLVNNKDTNFILHLTC